MSSTCPHNIANFGPLTAEIGLGVWSTPANFNGFRVWPSCLRYCSDVAHRKPTKLWTMFGRFLGCYTIHTFSGAPARQNSARCKFHFMSNSILRWALVNLDGVAPSRMVSMSASVNLPLHHKVQKFSSGTGSPGWSRK